MPKTDNGFKSRDDPPQFILRCLTCEKLECNNCLREEIKKIGGFRKLGKV